MKIKEKAWYWFVHVFLKYPEGEIVPKWIYYLGCMVFPINAIRWNPKQNPRWDYASDCFIFNDFKISGAVFRAFSGEYEEGTYFQLLKRENGSITIKRFYPSEKTENKI